MKRPLTALAVLLTLPTSLAAQTVQIEDDIEVTLELVDTQAQSNVRVLRDPNFRTIVKPSDPNHDCVYRLQSDGTKSAEGGQFDTSGVVIIGNRTPRPNSECGFNGSPDRPKIEIECPFGNAITIGGRVEGTGFYAEIAPSNEGLFQVALDCEDGPFEPNVAVTLGLFADAALGFQQVTVPLEVTFE